MASMKGLVAGVLSSLVALAAGAAELTPAQVQITDGVLATPLTDKPGDPAAGIKAYSDRARGNCMTCHQNSNLPKIDWQGDVAPSLDGVASRYDEPTLRAIVVNAKTVFGEQTFMPAMFRDAGFNRPDKPYAGKPIMSAQEVEDVVAYLLTLKE